MKKLIAIIPKSLSRGVVQSQMITPLRLLSQNVEFEETSFEQPTRCIKNGRHVLNIVRRCNSPTVVYTRSQLDFFHLFVLKFLTRKPSLELWYDCRGLAMIEMSHKRKGIFILSLFYLLDIIIFRNADYITTVSSKNKLYIKNFRRYDDVLVVPSCTISRINAGYASKLEGRMHATKLCVAYVGGTSSWQNFNEICKVVASLKVSNNISFKIYSTDNVDEKVISSFGLSDIVEIRSLNSSEIMDALEEVDIGIIVRRKELINQFASPIKVSEYVAASVVPLIVGLENDQTEVMIDAGFDCVYETVNEACSVFEKESLDSLILKSVKLDVVKDLFVYENSLHAIKQLINV